MRITLMNNGTGIGYMEYQILNWADKLGFMGAVVTQPPQLATLIEHKIRTNAYGVVVSGGLSPGNLGMYWDGVVMTLNNIKREVPGFDYLVPAGEDPLQDTTPLTEAQKRKVN